MNKARHRTQVRELEWRLKASSWSNGMDQTIRRIRTTAGLYSIRQWLNSSTQLQLVQIIQVGGNTHYVLHVSHNRGTWPISHLLMKVPQIHPLRHSSRRIRRSKRADVKGMAHRRKQLSLPRVRIGIMEHGRGDVSSRLRPFDREHGKDAGILGMSFHV